MKYWTGSTLADIRLPAGGWRPREYQKPLWRYLMGGGKRAMAVWHRRAGKDDVMLHNVCVAAHERPASYWHCLPEFAQARKALWTSVSAHTGKRRLDEIFPREIRESTNEQEMFIRFKSGSTWQLIGSDNYNALVGAGVAGVTFSEWALANPAAWSYIRPMLVENNGWAAFITTPRGNNHAKSMLDMAQKTPGWFAEVLDVHTTGALSKEALDEALAEYQALYGIDFGRAYYEQEYECSFSGAAVGAYFGAEMAKAERAGRMMPMDIDERYPVHTCWDLGKAVNNPIWCFQMIPGAQFPLRIVDFYRPESDDLEQWVAWLDAKRYWGTDYVPHDIAATEWGSNRTRMEVLWALKRRPWRIPKVSVADGLQAGRTAINAAFFHLDDDERGQRVAYGIDGLKNYRREWDDELKTFRENPLKDWAEHIGSAWRYLGLAYKEVVPVPAKPQRPVPGPGQIVLPPARMIRKADYRRIDLG